MSEEVPHDEMITRTYNTVLSQTFSDSGYFLFAGNRFGDIFVYDIRLMENTENVNTQLKVYPQGGIEINALCFHRDFLIVGAIGEIYGLKWNEDTGELSSKRKWNIKLELKYDGTDLPDVNAMCLQGDSDTLFAVCGDKIYQISLEHGWIERIYKGHNDYIHDICRYNNRLYTASEDGIVKFWSKNDQESIEMIEPVGRCDIVRPKFGNWVGAVVANENWLICGGGPKLSLWNLPTMCMVQDFEFPGKVHVCDFVEDSIFVAGEHNHAEFYNFNGGLESKIQLENTATYSMVWQKQPIRLMSVAGFSNKLHILKDFRFIDCKLSMYGNLSNENYGLENEDEFYNDNILFH